MNKTLIPLILASTVVLTLSACNKEDLSVKKSAAPVVSKQDAIAVVNGQYISKNSLATLEKEIAQRSRGQSVPKDKLIEELIQRELLLQDAKLKKLDQSKEFTEKLATVEQALLSQEAVQNYVKSNPITDADLQAEYDSNAAKAGNEYKARHILVKTEEEAKAIIKQLSKGADFVELAKTKSVGPSNKNGGDLGWFASGQMVPPFSKAVMALEDNKFTTEAVKTQFGYHVILREGVRAQTLPDFNSVKEQIRPMLQRKQMQDYIGSLREKAKIEIFESAAEEKKVSAIPPASSTSTSAAPADSGSSTTKEVPSKVANALANKAEQVKNIATEKAVEAGKKVVKEVTEKVVTP